MKKQSIIRIYGAGGGKGGSGTTYEADDNLFSRQSAAFIDALSEGPIKGLVYGDASILVDEVRLRNINLTTGIVDAKTNFNNFVMTTSTGDSNPDVNNEFFSDYPTAAVTQTVNSPVLLANESQFFTISSGTFEKINADYLKITISTNGMSAVTKKGDNKGDINTTKVYFNIDFVFTDSSGVTRTVNKFNTGFNGKVKSKYAHTFGFNIENEKETYNLVDWAIKVTKTSASPKSSDQTEISYDIFVDSIEASIADKLRYPYTAYVAGVIDAEQFSSIPKRGYEIDGRIISVPSNHMPCDYNGRKITVASASGISVGDTVKQVLDIDDLDGAAVDTESVDDDSNSPTNGICLNGYVGTATLSANHGVATGKTFTVTISGVTTDSDFYNGTFVAESLGTNKFKYNLNQVTGTDGFMDKPTDLTNLAGASKKAELFTGAKVDKINGTTLFLRDVPASNSIVNGAITFTNSSNNDTSTTVSESEKVFIPANYRRNVTTGRLTTQDQDWDGNFYQSWCNNPAWVFYDLAVNKIYGLGNYLTETQINKWELFQIGRYCDELVPAGIEASDFQALFTTADANYIPSGATGEHEPRFSANLVINGKEEAYKVLNDVVSIFRGMIYWLNGEAFVVQDSEKDPVYQFTNGNVIDGTFSYEGTANKTRTNSVAVSFNNPQDYYRKRVEYVELEETLQKDAEFLKPQSITAFGCTSRGQARRLGKWTLLTNNLHTNTVTFETSLNAAFLKPGDIIQIIDQLKSGKSWGGRISNDQTTGGSSSIIRLDRQPSGFSDDDVETGYVPGDYRLSATFVKYAALLAQDTATISISGTDTTFVRGQEIPNIASEEAATQIQDTNNNLVFTQWTPYTVVETQTLDSVNGPNSFTVANAFSASPTAESIWTLSRPSLQTGKTKEESKLFRVMSVAETNLNTFEITALEYNASKFDAVDKNEALTKYRTINLPDSFEEVPEVTNIELFGTAEVVENRSRTQTLNISWDPATKSDGTPYQFLRGYLVEWSTDGEKWSTAGNTTSTTMELERFKTGSYYARVYTVNMMGKKSSAAESGLVEVNFDSVLYEEGSVGTGKPIPFFGKINSEFNIDTSGTVSFAPTSFTYNNGSETDKTVTNQANLDFSSMSNNTEAYVYFDYSDSAFKAIAWDITSDQFYPVGQTIFKDATSGTISTAGNSKTVTGSGTVFNTDIPSTDSKIKFTKSSTDYYPRVKSVSSNTSLTLHENFSHAISSGTSFDVPRFFPEFTAPTNATAATGTRRDSIMGKVVKDGSGNYELIQFGVSRGESGYSVFGTNESHVFAAGNNGEIAQSDYSAYTNDYTVSKGSVAYTFATGNTAENTFGLSVSAVTGFSATSDVNISGSGQITIDDNAMDSVSTASATIVITDLGAGTTISTRVISFAKATSGTIGTSAKTVNLTGNVMAITYDEDGSTPSPSSITLTADSQNFDDAYFKFTGGGSDFSNESSFTDGTGQNQDTATFTSPTSYEAGDAYTFTVEVQEGDSGGAVASDVITIPAVKAGSDAVTVSFPNSSHVFPKTAGGTIDLTGSGASFVVFKGATILTQTQGTPGSGQCKITQGSAPTGITLSTANPTLSTHNSVSNGKITFPAVSAVAGSFENGDLEYSINIEGRYTMTVSQQFVVATDGTDGDTVNFAFVRVPEGTSASSVTAATDGTENTPANFTISSTEYTWSDDVPSGTGLLFAVKGTKAGTATGFTWGTPYRLEGTMAKELIIYSNVTTGDAPSDPTATYNFTTGVLSLTSNANLWNLTPPSFGSTPANGAKIHAVTCVVTGSINDTAVAVATSDWSAAFIHAIHEKGDTGASAVTVILTNESTTALTYRNRGGIGISYGGTGGEMKLYDGATEQTSGVVYGGSGFTDNGSTRSKTQNGLTCTINESTGVYSFSGADWTTENETFTLQATYESATYSKVISINKVIGLQRVEINASANVFKFDTTSASSADPTSITLTATAFAFGGGTISYKWYKDGTAIDVGHGTGYGSTNSFSVADGSFSDGNAVYKVQAKSTLSGSDPFDEDEITIARIADGSDGDPAANTAQVRIYKRSSSSSYSTKPTSSGTYTFSTGALTGTDFGSGKWTTSVPAFSASTPYLYTCTATATGTVSGGVASTTATIPTSAWSDVESGGGVGETGRRAQVVLFYDNWSQGSALPSEPTIGSNPYNFSNDTLTFSGTGWALFGSQTLPWVFQVITITEDVRGGTQTVERGALTPVFINFGIADLTGYSDGDFKNSHTTYAELVGDKPPSDANNYVLPSDVLKGTISVSGQTVTIPKADGTTYNITTQDTNTTYSASDFNIEDLSGYADGTYKNSHTTYAELQGTKPPTNAEANPSISTIRGYFSGSGYNSTTGVITDTNTTYSASDFNITQLAGYSAANYLNSNVSITDAMLAGSSTITLEGDFEYNGIAVSTGAQASSFSTTDGSSYTANNTTGTITVTHPLDSVADQSCTYTWSRSGDNVSGFALTNTGSGADAWSSSTFGSAATTKTITVTHTQSGLTIDMTCYIIDTSSSGGGGGGGGGGCFLPGTLVDLEDGTQQAIETLVVEQKVRGGTVTAKQSYEVDYWYKLNDLELTAGHPVWIEGKGWACIDPTEYYKEAEEFGHAIQVDPVRLNIGDKTTNGKIERIERIDEKATVWNITVDKLHTYYVNGILVHNSKN